jgi:hypothetical protein
VFWFQLTRPDLFLSFSLCKVCIIINLDTCPVKFFVYLHKFWHSRSAFNCSYVSILTYNFRQTLFPYKISHTLIHRLLDRKLGIFRFSRNPIFYIIKIITTVKKVPALQISIIYIIRSKFIYVAVASTSKFRTAVVLVRVMVVISSGMI